MGMFGRGHKAQPFWVRFVLGFAFVRVLLLLLIIIYSNGWI